MALSQAVREAFEKGGNGGGRQPALADNARVRVVIQPSKKDIGYIEREPFSSKPESPNHRIQALRLRLVIPEGAQHSNRNFFASIPTTFEMWSERNQGLVPSYQSIGLVKALGYSLENVEEDTLAKLTDRELLGKSLELVLGVEDDPRFDASNHEEAAKAAQNPLYAKRNFVRFINAPSASAPAVPAGGYSAPASGGHFPPSSGGYAPPAAPPAAAQPAPANDPWAAAAFAGGATI